MPRMTYSAYTTDLEKMAGACETAAKNVCMTSRERALFLLGAAAGIDQLFDFEAKPEDAHYRVDNAYPEMVAKLGAMVAEEIEDV